MELAGKKKKVYLLCNSHLDPVWQWQWQEGAAETLSTFRTAAELCEQNKTFVFNHNEAILYKWIHEYEPALFSRIQKLVKQGRWHIMGGWYLQPDCNMPSGESFVRQILLGKEYFRKHFGVEPKTAINFDPFGHCRGLVQILAKSGYDSYLFGRPEPRYIKLPNEDFVWVGYDGSEIMGTRFCGPSKHDLKNVNKLIKDTKDCNIQHSTPDAYFKELQRQKAKLPRYRKDLNPWAIGCYTSQIRIKQKHRLLENEIFAAEKMISSASTAGLMKYPHEDIHEALCDLMTGQFHDILPGSSIQEVEEDALRMLDHGLEIISRIKAKAFFALSSGQSKAKKDTIPIMVYNPHPYRIKQIFTGVFQLASVGQADDFMQIHLSHNGLQIPCQVEKEAGSLPSDWCKKVAFPATLEPGQMNRFDCSMELLSKKPPIKLKPRKKKIIFKTKELEVVINTDTGLVDRYRIKGIDHVKKGAFEPIVITDNADSWEMVATSFGKVEGRFKLLSKRKGSLFSGIRGKTIDSVRIVEDGDVRSIIEAVFGYGDSFICQRYKLPKIGTEIEIETRVYWNEKDRMLKLSVPVAGEKGKYLGQVAYGVSNLPDNGNEAVSQRWTAVVNRKENKALTCINDCIYGSDYSENGLRLTLLRSPAYTCCGILREDARSRFLPRIDQGERIYNFWFNGGGISQRLKAVDREAMAKNEKPVALSFFPPGGGKKPKPVAVLSDSVVQITAIKRAQRNNNLIFRLFEPTGRKRTTTLTLPAIGKKIKIDLNAFEIKTLKVNPKTRKVTEVNLLEKSAGK